MATAAQRAVQSATPPKRDVRKPVFVVRAPDPNNPGRWVTLGAAWERKNNEPGFTIKLNAVPVGPWDGALILLPPLPNEELPAKDD